MVNLQILRWCESDESKRRLLRLCLAWMWFLTGVAAAQEPERAGSPTRVEYTVDELSPSGTVIGILAEAYPRLQNFRITSGSGKKAFSVDSVSGTLIVRNPRALDFERRSVHVLTVTADAESQPVDAFLDDFKASLLEEGASSGNLELLTSVERKISVTVRIQDVPEPTQPTGDSVGNSNDPIVPELTQPTAIAVPETTPEVTAVVIDTPSAGTETIASPEVVVSVPESQPAVPPVDSLASVLSLPDNTSTEQSAPSVGRDAVQEPVGGAVDGTVLVESPAGSSPSHVYAAVGILLIVLLVAGAIMTVLLRRASNARKETIRLQEEVEAANIQTVTAIPKKAVEVPESAQPLISSDVAIADQHGVEASDQPEVVCVTTAARKKEKSTDGSNRDPESMFSDDYLLEPSHSSKPDDREPLQQMQTELDARDAMIAELTQRLSAGDRRFDSGGLQGFEASVPFAAIGHEIESEEYEPAESGWTPEPTVASRQRDNYGCDDAGESLAQARNRLEQSMDLHTRSSGEQFRAFQHEVSPSSIATLAPAENLRAELCGLFAMQLSAPNASPPPVAEPPVDAELDDAPAEVQQSDSAHQDSIARYLSNLLDRNKEESAAESPLADRRKSAGKSDGSDRRGERAAAPERKPVKSYLEAYMKDHGGHLSDEQGASVRVAATLPEVRSDPKLPAEPPVERTPVDVTSIRENMTSFRQVAMKSVEHALALHSLQQAQGALAFRKILLFALLLITVFIVTANMLQAIHLYSLNWLMGVIVVLCFSELCLRTQRLRHDRRELISRAATPQSDAELSEQDSPADSASAAVAG